MNQIKLGSKWASSEDLGNIHRFMQKSANNTGVKGETIMNNTITSQVDDDLESIVGEELGGPKQEETIDPTSAAIEISCRLEYSSSATVDKVFNSVADLLKLSLDARKIDKDSKLMWISSNVGKLNPADTISIYKMLSSG